MMHFPLMINDRVIYQVYIGNLEGPENGVCVYQVKVIDYPLGEECYSFIVKHDRRDGCWKLMELVCAKIHDLETKDD
jgi:hypothetical protein